MNAKRTIRQLASRLGYTVVPDWQLDRFAQARYLARLLAESGVAGERPLGGKP